MVFTIFHPPDMVPSEMAVKQENATQSGRSSILFIPIPSPSECPAIIAAAMIPITFCESFRPCPMLNKAEDTSCSFLNHNSAVWGCALRQMYKTNNVKPNATTIPIKGARKMNAAIFRMILNWMASKPCAMMAAPAKPPISVCEEEEGIPFHQVNRFQAIAAITPARMIGKVM